MIIETAVSAVASSLLNAMTSEVGKDAYKKGKEILDSLRKRFASNPNAVELLANYEQQPLRHDADLRGFLMDAANSDPEFAGVLKRVASVGPTIGTQNIHNEIVHGSKTVSNTTIGRDSFQGNTTFGRPSNSRD